MASLASPKVEENVTYGFFARLLHRFTLNYPVIGQTAFELEKMFFKPGESDDHRHVFICGLARAGTTAVLMKLYETGCFRSLTYRDMPFILAPNCWYKVSRLFQKDRKLRQRVHGDGIYIGPDSPEAFEEIFWKTFYASEYIKPDSLIPMEENLDCSERFKQFVSLVVRSAEQGQRYLSKNNNNVLRMQTISRIFPDSIFVLPFRNPLQQAWSLRNQHNHFLRIHKEDRFAASYMSWLGHYEFGSDYRPNRFNRTEKSSYTVDTLAHWLERWVETYLYILEHLPKRSILISYEKLCENPGIVWNTLLEELGLPGLGKSISFKNSYHRVDESVPEKLLARANQLYDCLVRQSIGG